MSRLMFFPAKKRFEGFLPHFPEGIRNDKRLVWCWRHIVVRLLCPEKNRLSSFLYISWFILVLEKKGKEHWVFT